MNFNNEKREMQVESVHPGITKEQVIENTGFDIKFAEDLKETDLPHENEIYLLRNVIDPNKLYI